MDNNSNNSSESHKSSESNKTYEDVVERKLDEDVIYDNAGVEQLGIIENIREQLKKLNLSNRNVVKNILEDKNIISDPVQVQGASAYPTLEDLKSDEEVEQELARKSFDLNEQQLVIQAGIENTMDTREDLKKQIEVLEKKFETSNQEARLLRELLRVKEEQSRVIEVRKSMDNKRRLKQQLRDSDTSGDEIERRMRKFSRDYINDLVEETKALHQNDKVTVADLTKQESEVTYADLMRRKKKVKKKISNFDEINPASDEDEDEFHDASEVSEDEVSQLQKAVKFADRKKKSDNVSTASSIFNRDKAQILQNKLEQAKKKMNKALKNFSENSVMLTEARSTGKEALKYLDKCEESGSIKVSPPEGEQFDDLSKDIEKLIDKVNIELNNINIKNEQMKNKPRTLIPKYNCKPSGFIQFMDSFIDATRFYTNKERVVALKSSVIGRDQKEKAELEKIFSNIDNFDDMHTALVNKFGTLKTLVPSLLSSIRSLKTATTAAEEVSNILEIIDFYNLCKSHKMEEIFDHSLYLDSRKKLLVKHQDDLKMNKVGYINNEREINIPVYLARLNDYLKDDYEEISESSVVKSSSGNPPPKKSPSDTKFFNANVKDPRCRLCSQSHLMSSCHLLTGKTADDIKDILKNLNLCPQCVYPLDKNHKSPCNKTFNKKLKKNIFTTCYCRSNLNKFLCCKKNEQSANSGTVPKIPKTTSNVAGIKKIAAEAAETQHEDELVNDAPIGFGLGEAQVLKIKSPSGQIKEVLCMFDSQSQNTFVDPILKPFLSDIKDMIYSVQTVNGSELVQGARATFEVLANNQSYKFHGLMKKLECNYIRPVSVKIPSTWKTDYKLEDRIQTCSGFALICFGQDRMQYFPLDVAAYQGLRLKRSFFDEAAILTGCDSNLMSADIIDNTTKFNRIIVGDVGETLIDSHELNPVDKTWLELHNPHMHHMKKKACQDCRENEDCEKCELEIGVKSQQEILEEKLLDKSVQYDAENQLWTFDNPFKVGLNTLPDYKFESLQQTRKLEKRLRSIPDGEKIASALDSVIQKNIDAGKYQWQSDKIKNDPSFANLQFSFHPVNYARKISESTPCRLTQNLSYKRGNSPSYNCLSLKGNSLNYKLFYILLNSRGWKYQIVGDISKFYESIRVSDKTAALTQFFWKKGGILSQNDFEPVVSMVQQFGQQPAQHVSCFCRNETSRQYILPVSPLCHQFVLKAYTDDVSSFSQQSLSEAKARAKIITEGLACGNFRIKSWSHDLEATDKKIPLQGSSSILGMDLDLADDTWQFRINLNFGEKLRGLRSEKYLVDSEQALRKFVSENQLTKRQFLRGLHYWDPLSLTFPVRNNLNSLYRKVLVTQSNLGWDEKVNPDYYEEIIRAFIQVLELKKLKIPRCGIPRCWKPGDPLQIVAFLDGSAEFSVAKLFLRCYNSESKTFEARFLVASSKMGHLGPNNSVKMEMDSCLLCCKLIQTVIQSLDHLKFEEVIMISDSKIVLAMLKTFSARLKLYFNERVAECQKIIQKYQIKVFHIGTQFNLSNDGSKIDLKTNHCLTEKFWTGDFLCQEMNSWPLEEYSFSESHLDKIINSKMSTSSFFISPKSSQVNYLVDKYQSFDKICRIITYVKTAFKKMNFFDVYEMVKLELYKLARPTNEQIEGIKRYFYVEKSEEGVFILSRHFKLNRNILQQKMLLLNGKSLIGKKILHGLHLHLSSSEKELTQMYEKGLFLIGARDFFRSLQKKCLTCVRIRQTTVLAKMGPTLLKDVQDMPNFYACHIDIKGPLKAYISRKNTKSFWIFGLSDIKSRYTVFTLLLDLTANSCLTALKTAAYQTGGILPRQLHSDWGKNLVTIQRIQENVEDPLEEENTLSMEALRNVFRENQVELILSSPKAPFRQSQIESIFKILGTTLKRSGIAGRKYHISDWVHILAFLTYCVNIRPLNLKFCNETFTVLNPMKMVFGERGNYFTADRLNLNISGNKLYENLSKLESQLQMWKNIWCQTFLQEGMKIMKWKVDSQELKLNSIVLITDHFNSNTLFPAIGIVERVISPRTFLISYVKKEAKLNEKKEIIKPAILSTLIRPAQSLVFLTQAEENVIVDLDPFPPAISVEKDSVPEYSDKAPDPNLVTVPSTPVKETNSTPDPAEPDSSTSPEPSMISDSDKINDDKDKESILDSAASEKLEKAANSDVNNSESSKNILKFVHDDDIVGKVYDIAKKKTKNKKSKK